MIYTLTLNPALDYIVTVPDYKEGTVNRTKREKILPGGKGINVSAVLNNLGVPNVALGFVSGFTGEVIDAMLKDMSVNTDFINLNNGFSRINVKIKAGKETEINGVGPEIDSGAVKKLYEKLDKLVDDDTLVLAGAVPKTFPQSIYYDLIKYLDKKAVRIVVDATGKLLCDTLELCPFLIKPNDIELGEIFGKVLKTDGEIIDAAKELKSRGAGNVLVSMGKRGAILVAGNGDVLKCRAPEGEVINTTGAGDSTVAGFLAGYNKTGDFEYALRLGVASGSASAFSENLATREETEALFRAVKTEKYT